MNFKDKIKELKPQDLNCNVFDVYNYNGLSMQELLCQFFHKINECIKISNETIDLASWLVNEGLSIEVVNKLMLWLEDGTLEDLINVNLFNSLNTKIDNFNSQLNTKIDNLNSQLEHISKIGKTVYLDEYYNGDFSEALSQILEYHEDVTTVLANGVYFAENSCKFTNINNVSIVGSYEIKAKNDIGIFLEFKNCDNIKIDGMSYDACGFSNYRTLDFNDCSNICVNNIFIKNVKNTNLDYATFNIKIYSNNYDISNIRFENITHFRNKRDVTSGKGSITNIHISVDKTHQYGNIDNIKAFDCYNIDIENNTILSNTYCDVDVIKTQYMGGLSDENITIDSKIYIKNVEGVNFGKRLVKLQTSGVIVEGLNGESYDGSCFSCIGIHSSNVTVKNIDFKCNSAYNVIEIVYYNNNIKVENVNFEGTLKESFATIASRDINMNKLISKNIFINNVFGKFKAPALLILNNSFENITLNNFNIDIDCDSIFTNYKSPDCKTLKNFVISNSNINIKSYAVLDINNVDFIDLKLKSTKINHTSNSNNRVIVINNEGYNSTILIDDVEFNTNSTYKWGYIWTNKIKTLYVNNLISESENTILQNQSDTSYFSNCNIKNGELTDNTKTFSVFNGLICKTLNHGNINGFVTNVTKNSVVQNI